MDSIQDFLSFKGVNKSVLSTATMNLYFKKGTLHTKGSPIVIYCGKVAKKLYANLRVHGYPFPVIGQCPFYARKLI